MVMNIFGWKLAVAGSVALAPMSGQDVDQPVAPKQPSEIRCEPGPSAGTISTACKAEVETTDQVEFGVARADDPRRWAYVYYTAEVARDGTARAVIPGLEPDVEYVVKGRAHRRDTSEGWEEQWSAATDFLATCRAAVRDVPEADLHPVEDDEKEDAVLRRRLLPKSRWIEVFRFRGPGYAEHGRSRTDDYSLPDYLDNHNTGDAYTQLSHWDWPGSSFVNDFSSVSYTRYCIEILDVELNTPWHAVGISSRSRTSPFSSYLPCDGGECHCPNKMDALALEAEIASPSQWVELFCPANYWDPCICDKDHLLLSWKYTGRWTFSPPFSDRAHANWKAGGAGCGWWQHEYPCHEPADPKGYWYHHPAAGQCKAGEELGEKGCTWKRAPLMHTVSVQDLLDAGSIGGKPAYHEVTREEELQYVRRGQNLFRRVGAAPCGTVPPPQHSGPLPRLRQHGSSQNAAAAAVAAARSTPSRSAASYASLKFVRLAASRPTCFAGEGMVATRRAGMVPLELLEAGTEVLTSAGTGERIFERVLGFLHEQQRPSSTLDGSEAGMAAIITLEHARGEFRATAKHLLLARLSATGGRAEFAALDGIVVGHEVQLGGFEKVQWIRVLAVRRDYSRRTLVAPLTRSGHVIVDQISASNYAIAEGGVSLPHAAIHAAFYSQRLWGLAANYADAVRARAQASCRAPGSSYFSGRTATF
eukprot:TRINITY_DN65633_c0_g1_i2.p1 TRINITY_DN65633_c0_g1~~TRINITY_DN65633_c0_g1_i2.p1  ORF type:complete len:702 (-),score=86.05 TRINITY_DN65633_c0_g1_i2:77-2182(-)